MRAGGSGQGAVKPVHPRACDTCFVVPPNQGRLWVLTNWDREEFSYLDVFGRSEYAGTVRVRHRAVGFDVLGSTLAVLVERPVGEDGADGFPDRGIDWYDVSGLEFGVADEEAADPIP